jgi:hypothetical protein
VNYVNSQLACDYWAVVDDGICIWLNKIRLDACFGFDIQ